MIYLMILSMFLKLIMLKAKVNIQLIFFNCTAITIKVDYNFKNQIPHFIDEDIDRPDPYFASFKRISLMNLNSSSYKDWVKKFELIDRASICIDKLSIRDEMFEKMWETQKDKLQSLKIDWLLLFFYDFELSREAIEVLNEVKLNMLTIYDMNYSFDYFKLYLSLNLIKIQITFKDSANEIHYCATKINIKYIIFLIINTNIYFKFNYRDKVNL